MNFLIFASAFLVVTAAKPPQTPSEECAACQLFTTILGNVGNEKETHSIASSATSVCSTIPNCEVQREHCEIVFALENSIAKLNQSSIEELAMKEILDQTLSLCRKEPSARVLQLDGADSPTLAKCLLCFMVKNVLQFVNNSIAGGWMEELVMNLIKKIAAMIDMDPDMPITYLATFVFQSLRDSMGAFYKAIAVDGFKCPSFENLNNCYN